MTRKKPPAIESSDRSAPMARAVPRPSKLGFEPLKLKPGVYVFDTATITPQDRRRLRTVDVRQAAKARYVKWDSLPTEPPIHYEGIHRFEREYLRDSLVGPCIDVLAFFSTNKGFDTVLEPTVEVAPEKVQEHIEPYKDLKAYVDRINGQVQLDDVLRTAVIDAKIFGRAGFEISLDSKGDPEDLIQKYPPDLKPDIDENYKITGFTFGGKEGYYKPEQLLYFVQRPRRRDMLGRGDIERIIDTINARRSIITEAIPEATKVLWAGVVLLFVDTSNLPSGTDPGRVMDDIEKQIKPGKWLLFNHKVEADIVDLKPDLQKLLAVKEDLDQEIIGNFQVPRFLVGRTKDYNRATAYSIMEAFVNGSIADIQRWLRRALENQWYSRLVRKHLQLGENETPPVRIKHQWKPISVQDYVELASVVAELYSSGVITRKRGYQMLGYDPKELEEEKETPPTQTELQVVLKKKPKKMEQLTVD